MTTATQNRSNGRVVFRSSIKADAWHRPLSPAAYNWWYFDALSDDGSEALVINFLDNSVFSPRYNGNLNTRGDLETPEGPAERYPAVMFSYYRDGKPVYRTMNEYSAGEFTIEQDRLGCTIGDCSFYTDAADYGSGYAIAINASLSRGRRLEAHFEWLSIESDFEGEEPERVPQDACMWNLAAPRSDVTGRISVFDRRGELTDVRHFRGTGYHDHLSDRYRPADRISERFWGRAHFADSTAVFHRMIDDEGQGCSRLYISREGRLREREVQFEEINFVRDKFGIKYPTRLRLVTDDNLRLRVKAERVIDSSFYFVRFLSDMTLTLRDGRPRRATGLCEIMTPKTLKYRWLDWLVDMRIGKKGKGSLI